MVPACSCSCSVAPESLATCLSCFIHSLPLVLLIVAIKEIFGPLSPSVIFRTVSPKPRSERINLNWELFAPERVARCFANLPYTSVRNSRVSFWFHIALRVFASSRFVKVSIPEKCSFSAGSAVILANPIERNAAVQKTLITRFIEGQCMPDNAWRINRK